MSRRGRAIALVGLLFILGYVLVNQGSSESRGLQPGTQNRRASAEGASRASVVEVPIDRIDRALAGSATPGRDLFGYYVPPPPPPKPPTPEELAAQAAAREAADKAARDAADKARRDALNAPPPPPPPPPPINLKFQGFVEEKGVKYAVLKDPDRGVQYVGKEGDTVAFRFKVLKIGHASVDMGYVDHPDHHQIDLSGS